MKLLSTFLKTAPAEASASDLQTALQAAETERQALREREQALAVERQDALLSGTDEDLDRIEAELTAIARAAERHDLRIPELRRLHGERWAKEQAEADRHEFSQAVAQRLAIAERIDAALAELGDLFGALEGQSVILRRLDRHHQASRKLNGPMSVINLDREDLTGVILHHLPTVAFALGLEPHSSRPAMTFHSAESRVWNRLTHGPEPISPGPETRQTTPEEAEAAEITRQQQRRWRDVGPLSQLLK